jgi:hypothetical protein
MSNTVTFKQLLSSLNETFASLPDVRKGRNKHYSNGVEYYAHTAPSRLYSLSLASRA